MSTHAARLAALRDQLAAERLAGFVVPLTDEHMSEYVGAYAQRLAWLTGFGGSAGSAVVLADKAAMFTDGRYTLQVRAQVDGGLYDYVAVPGDVDDRLARGERPRRRPHRLRPLAPHPRLGPGDRRGAGGQGREPRRLPANPIDAVWADRPAPSAARLEVHPEEFAGETSAAKRDRIAAGLRERGADVAVITALDSIAWLFNVRGKDVDRTPVPLAFALVHADASADLFVDAAKLSPRGPRPPGPTVRIADRDAFPAALEALAGQTVVVDPASAVAAVFEHLAGAPSSRRATRASSPRRSRTRPRSPAARPPTCATARR